MKYEILMVNITRNNGEYSQCFNDSIGQYSIAAYIRQYGFRAKIISGNTNKCLNVIESELSSNNVPIIGFYAAADNVRIVSNTIKKIKKMYDVKTVVGGPQADDLNEKFFEETNVDYVIVGEGEIPILKLLTHVIDNMCEISDVPCVKYVDKSSKRLIYNYTTNAVIENLDEIPYPTLQDSYDGTLRQGEMVGIITGRGCPNNCSFCYEGANAKNVRFRSIQNVMEEIDYIIANNKRLQYINVYDDTFTLNVDRVIEFCSEIKKRKVKWFCEGHIEFIVKHPEILKIMVESGLTSIQFGIESGSEKVLDAYKKRTNKEMILDCVRICKESGIHGISGNFIIGGALETKETLEESKRLAKELIEVGKGIIELYTVYFAPYPNTQMVKHPEKYEIKIDKKLLQWNLNTMRSPVLETNALSTREIFEAKQEFDEHIMRCYHQSAIRSYKNDLLQCFFEGDTLHNVCPTWEKIYSTYAHFNVFLKHLTVIEQDFSIDKFPIRTFEDFCIIDNRMCTPIGDFCGNEMLFLLNSVGKYNLRELAEVCCLTLDEIENLYISLNSRCLVYLSLV